MKHLQFLLAFLFSVSVFSCKDDQDPVYPEPKIDKVEIGLNNNEIGIIGRDFHLNAEILAGDKIDLVQVKIQPRSGENYASPWSYEITWEQYKGAKNATVHKHFDIPADAIEGMYDFLIIVTDQNGSRLEEKRSITLYSQQSLPVDLRFDFGVEVVDADFNSSGILYSQQTIYDSVHYKSDEPISESQFLAPVMNIAGIKGDGKMYSLIINKKHNHRPETFADIDFSKAIVADVWEHRGLSQSETGSNMYDFSTRPISFFFPSIEIGAANDRNTPSQPISGIKAWESGDYYVGFIYHNSTHNMGVFHYGEVSIKMN
jgi:hypothetical protein